MINVVFVAPFFLRATVQFIEGAARLKGIRLILVSQDPAEMLEAGLRAKLFHHERLANALEADALAAALGKLQQRFGKIARLIGTLEQLQVPLAQVREMLDISGMGVETARNFREKSRMKTVLRSARIPCARHCLARSAAEAAEFADSVGYPVVVKPPAGAGSRDTFQIDTRHALKDYLDRHGVSANQPVLFEEFIMGNEHTFDSVLIDGRMVWHAITRYFPTPLQVLKNPSVQWCVLLPREIDHPHFDDIRQTALSANRTLGLRTGLSHLEWFRRIDGTIAVSEVGARPPGGQITSMHGYAGDFDIHSAWARLMVFGEFDPPQRRFAAGTVFLRGLGKGRVKAVHGLGQIREELGSIIVEAKLPQIGQPASGTYEGEGYVMLRHPQTGVIEKALDRVISTIRIDLANS